MSASNPGTADRVLRTVLVLILLAVALLTPDVAWASADRAGVVPLVTGLLGWCVLYRRRGVSARRRST